MQSNRPSVPPRARSSGYRREGRWPSMSWWLSSILIVALAAWAITFLIRAFDEDDSSNSASDSIAIIVTDSQTGLPVVDAELRVGSAVGRTNESGTVMVPLPASPVTLTISHAGYHPVYGELNNTMAAQSAGCSQPESAETGGTTGDVQPQPTETAAGVTETATTSETPASGQTGTGVTGVITDASGNPIVGATILAGGAVSFSDDTGYFEVPAGLPGQQFRVWASGYRGSVSDCDRPGAK